MSKFNAIGTAYVSGAIVLFALLSVLFPDIPELINAVTAATGWWLAIVGVYFISEWRRGGVAMPIIPLAARLSVSVAFVTVSVSAQVGHGVTSVAAA